MLKKQDAYVQESFFETCYVFTKDQFDSRLNNHKLQGKKKGTRSINITGDVRVHYQEIDGGFLFLNIGTHAELYK
jgi:mRNA-degrading endonuclease YafQ of YafQ-DinJ toxin-antitoxin module